MKDKTQLLADLRDNPENITKNGSVEKGMNAFCSHRNREHHQRAIRECSPPHGLSEARWARRFTVYSYG